MAHVSINGYTHPAFEKVEQAFEDNFHKRNDIGATCCIYFKGEKVVDLWGGKKHNGEPWNENDVCIVFSTSKGISSLAFALLHSKGYLDYDEKVSTYWKAFACNGKEEITIRQLLAHQAGLFSNDKSLTYEVLTNPDVLSNALAKQKTYWKPGLYRGYHAWTIAMYQNEICKRVDPQKRTLDQFAAEELFAPLDADFSIGMKPDFDFSSYAHIIPFYPHEALKEKGHTDIREILKGILNPFSFFYKSLLNPPHALNLNNFNKRKYLALPLGSAHGIGNARSIAAIYNEFATGGKKLGISKETLAQLEASPIACKSNNYDLVLHVDIPFSLGFAKPSFFQNFGVNYRAYGTFGAGGSGGFADPEKEIAFSYVMNKMGTHIANDPRELALRTAVYDCVFELAKNKQENLRLKTTV